MSQFPGQRIIPSKIKFPILSVFPEPWGYWKMEENGIADRIDSISGNNFIVNVNPVSAVAGHIGNASHFNSLLHELKCYAVPVIGINEPFFFAFWFKLITDTTILGGDIFFQLSDDVFSGQIIVERGKTFYFISGAGEGTMIFSPVPLTLGTYHFLVVQYDGSEMKLKIDDITVASGLSDGMISVTNPISIGGPSLNGDCEVDEIGYWNCNITDTQASYLYNSGSGRTYPFS